MRRFHVALLLTSAAVTAAALAGCQEAIHNSGEDDRFIRTSDNTQPAVALGSGSLLPAGPIVRWQDRLTIRRLDAPDAGEDPNAADGGGPQVFYADITAAGSHPLSGGGTSVSLEMRRHGQTAPFRAEIYRTDDTGVSLTSIGVGAQRIVLTPAMPLIRLPIHEGAIQQWQGTARAGKQSVAIQGYSRVAFREQLDLPAGKIGAYRVDSILMAPAGGRLVPIPITRWFAPGIGIVKQRFLNSDTEVTAETIGNRSHRR